MPLKKSVVTVNVRVISSLLHNTPTSRTMSWPAKTKISVIFLSEMHLAWGNKSLAECLSYLNIFIIYIYRDLLSFSSSVCSSTEALRAFLSKSPISCPAEGHTDTRISPQTACREISMRRYSESYALSCSQYRLYWASQPASHLKQGMWKIFLELISCLLPLFKLLMMNKRKGNRDTNDQRKIAEVVIVVVLVYLYWQ